MKKIIMLVVLIVVVPLSSSLAFFGGETFYVIFEKAPNIINDKVISKNFKIGDIKKKELGRDNMVKVTIKIDETYVGMIQTNGVFLADNGRLTYETVGRGYGSLPQKSKILGFANKPAFLWFKTRYHLKKFSDAAIEKAEELYLKFK